MRVLGLIFLFMIWLAIDGQNLASAGNLEGQKPNCGEMWRNDPNTSWLGRAASELTQKDYREECLQRVESDNGTIYWVNLGSIQRTGLGPMAIIYADQGGDFDVTNLRGWYFACDGHFMTGESNRWIYAPPLSVARRISDIVCAQPRND